MILYYTGIDALYEIENVVRIFYPHTDLREKRRDKTQKEYCFVRQSKYKVFIGYKIGNRQEGRVFELPKNDAELIITQTLFKLLSFATGYKPEWGMLTGVRPVAFMRSFFAKDFSRPQVEQIFKENYFVQSERLALALNTVELQQEIISFSAPNAYSLYISIPFCPSRCSYCSFVSQTTSTEGHLIPTYIEVLCKELKNTAKLADKLNLKLETVYIGGGTPTSLSEKELATIFDVLHKYFPMNTIKEFTVEAGRPDTITTEKLNTIKKASVTRISINPQTLNDEVLVAVHRPHTAQDFYNAFELARKMGFNNINVDLIAGLPKDTLKSFENTMEGIIKLKPENITVHTLTLKRASDIVIEGEEAWVAEVSEMVRVSRKLLMQEYHPYYLYRQKGTLQNLENVGYSLKGKECLYNIFIMEEVQTILSCGAGGSTKLLRSGEKKINRIFNSKYPVDYIVNKEKLKTKDKEISEFFL